MHYLATAILSLSLISAPLSAKAGDMTLDTFLHKVERLMDKGPLALVSSDLKGVKAEVRGAISDYRARITSDTEAARPPHSCPPEKGSIDSDTVMTHFHSYPASQRAGTTVRQAFFDLMKKKYPC